MSWLETLAMIHVIGIGIAFGIVGLMLLFVFSTAVIEWVKQSICKHDGGVNETRACEAICRKCGKNLGFIGTWREKHGH